MDVLFIRGSYEKPRRSRKGENESYRGLKRGITFTYMQQLKILGPTKWCEYFHSNKWCDKFYSKQAGKYFERKYWRQYE